MFGNNCGGNSCLWIIVLIILFGCCGNDNGNGCGCGCGNTYSNGCGCCD